MDDLQEVHKYFSRILLLGYKQVGRGEGYYNEAILNGINAFRARFDELPAARIAFDNLAIEQLRLKELCSPRVWERHFLGDDGHHSMFIDAVTDTYAISSRCPRRPINETPIENLFQQLI